MQRDFASVRRLVVKVGTSTLVAADQSIRLERMDALAFALSALRRRGLEVVLVSSGAMGFGLNLLGLDRRPADIARQQAISSVGQVALMNLYSQLFGHYQQRVSQLLLTRDVVEFPTSLANVRNALASLRALDVLPIVNENDAVSVEEMDHRTKFGDNDQLSALVAHIIDADLLLMLSDIDGLYDRPPQEPGARRLERVSVIDAAIEAAAGGSGSRHGTGGMASKVRCARMLLAENRQMVLLNGAQPRDLLRVLDGEALGTWFVNNKEN